LEQSVLSAIETKMSKTTKKFITHEAGNDEAWICICLNYPEGGGFYPCDARGDEIDAAIGSDWTNLYVCADCGRIINQDTLEVLGQNKNPKFLN
jgi:hypothetical protein